MHMAQTIVLLGAALFLVFLVRRWLQGRSITQFEAANLPAEKIAEDKSLILLDVRTLSEHDSQHIKGSLHIPLDELKERLGELESYRTRQIVCYCQSGSRSMAAAVLLRRNGFAAGNLKGGIAQWNFRQLKR